MKFKSKSILLLTSCMMFSTLLTTGMMLSKNDTVLRAHAAEATTEIDLTSQGYTNQQAVTEVTGGNIIITFDKGGNSNAPKYYTSGTAVRAYAKNTVTFTTADNKNITKIDFTFGSSDGSNAITADVGTFTSASWTGNSKSVTFTIGGTKGNRRLQKFSITTSDSETNPPVVENYMVTFDSKGGSAVEKQVAGSDFKVAKPTDPTKDGYKFGGWFKDEAYTQVFDFETEVVPEAGLTLYAKWDELDLTTIADFASQNPTSAITDNYYRLSGEVVGMKDDNKNIYIQDNTGAILVYSASALSDVKVGDTLTVVGKAGVYNSALQISNLIKHDVVAGDGTIATAPLTTFEDVIADNVNKYISLSYVETVAGVNGTGNNLTVSINGQTDIVLYFGSNWATRYGLDSTFFDSSKYVDVTGVITYHNSTAQLLLTSINESQMVNLTFNTNGGSEVASQKVIPGNTFTAPTETPTKDPDGTYEYEFAGWFEDEACTKQFDFTKSYTSDVVCYAGWNAKKISSMEYFESLETKAQILTGYSYYGKESPSVNMHYTGTTTINLTEDASANADLLNLPSSEGYTVTADKGSASNYPGLNKAGDLRIYNNNGPLTITSPKTIKKIVIDVVAADETYLQVQVNGAVVAKNELGEYEINSKSFSLVENGSTTININSIDITNVDETVVLNSPVMRFGSGQVDISAYNQNATYGVLVGKKTEIGVNETMKSVFDTLTTTTETVDYRLNELVEAGYASNTTFTSAEVSVNEAGNYFEFAARLPEVDKHPDVELTSVCYMILDNNIYFMQEKTYSFKSLGQYYVDNATELGLSEMETLICNNIAGLTA